jgi:hypothetical protein
MRKEIFVIGVLFSLASLSFFIKSAEADETQWRYQLTPYLWTAGLDIDTTTVRGRKASGEFDFGDIFENLDFSAAANFEAWKGKFGLIIDNFYLDLGTNADFPSRLGPELDADINIRMNLLEIAFIYHFDDRSLDEGDSPVTQKSSISIEPIGGLRWGWYEEEIDLGLTATRLGDFGELDKTLSDQDWWLELFAGARLKFKLNERLMFLCRGDIGGMSYQDESVFTWSTYAGLDYKPWNAVSLKLGYKTYDFYYKNDTGSSAFELDALLHGPQFGVTWWF